MTVLPAIRSNLKSTAGPVQKLRWAFDCRELNVHGEVASLRDRDRMLAYFHDYGLVWVQNTRIPTILQIWEWPHTHLDIDDLPSRSSQANESIKQRVISALLRRRERRYPRRFTTLSVCSEEDRLMFAHRGIHVIPNGFDRPRELLGRQLAPARPRLGFIGLFSHGPNLDGVRWFLRAVWPRVRAAVPGIRFRLIGKDSDGVLQPMDPDVDALGWIYKPAVEIATWSAMVVPIRYGGGTRIKIADGFSRKCPIVSTNHGAFGYEVEDRKQLRLVDDPAAFADACIELIRRPEIGTAMAERAWTDFLAKWTWDAITPKIVAAAEDCLRRSGASTA